MTEPHNILLVGMILLGLGGTLLPSLPGTAIILAGAVLHSLFSEFSPLTGQYLLILTLICLGGYIGQYLITALVSKKIGASKYGIIGACFGMLLGFFLPIPGGILAGAFFGAVAFEIFFEFKGLQEAIQSGFGALAGTLLSLFFEFTVGLIMTTLIFYLLFNTST